MIHKAPAMTVRQNLGELLNQVQYRQDSILITKGGKPIAALVDIPLFEKIRRIKEEFDRLSSEIAQAYSNTKEEMGITEIDQAVKTARAEGHSKTKSKKIRNK